MITAAAISAAIILAGGALVQAWCGWLDRRDERMRRQRDERLRRVDRRRQAWDAVRDLGRWEA
jgi:hypothetical protein